MNLILQNFLLQISALFIGIFGGISVVTFAEEELSLYKKYFSSLFTGLSFATLFVPILFFLYFSDFKKIIPFLVLGCVYVAVFWKTKDSAYDLSSGFLYIAPLTLFLASDDLQLFFLTLAFFLLTIMTFTVSSLSSFTKKNFFGKCQFFTQEFFAFFLMTVLLYSMTFFFAFL